MVGGRWSYASARGRGGNGVGGRSGKRGSNGQGNDHGGNSNTTTIEDIETQTPVESPVIGHESTALGQTLPEESPAPSMIMNLHISS
jgi:hypothetical protein